MNNYLEKLSSLPEPILITGHVNPDGDVIGSMASLLYLFKDKDIYYTFKGYFPINLKWILEGITDRFIEEPESFDYKSLVVLDCLDSSLRLGFNPKKDIEKLVIDHHDSSVDLMEEGKLSPSDYLISKDSFSTCGTLVDYFGFNFPLLYVGIYYDALLSKNNVSTAANQINKLEITDEDIKRFHELLEERKTIDSLNAVRDCYVFTYDFDDKLLCAITYAKEDNSAYFDLISVYSQYSDILVVYNETTGRVNIRTRKNIIDLSKFCSKYGGGGGYKGASLIVANLNSYQYVLKDLINVIEQELYYENKE